MKFKHFWMFAVFTKFYPWKIFIAKSGWDTSNPGSIIGNNKLIIGYSQKFQHNAKLNLRGQNLKKKYWIKSKEIHFSYFDIFWSFFRYQYLIIGHQRDWSAKNCWNVEKSIFVLVGVSYFCISTKWHQTHYWVLCILKVLTSGNWSNMLCRDFSALWQFKF